MKQFTIITKDGSKWLRPVNPYRPYGRQESIHDNFKSENPDLPYIGSHPEGTVVDESGVKEVRQSYNLILKGWQEMSPHDWACNIRAVYTDAEPPDIDYEKEMPHKKWPSTKYVARKVDGDRHISDDYWKIRAKAAEKLIGISPSDPKTYDEFCRIREEWEQIVKQEPK